MPVIRPTRPPRECYRSLWTGDEDEYNKNRFTATVTNDWNGNITSVQEVIPGGMNLTSTFTYDYENRLTEYAVGGTNFSVEHTYDGYNRLVKTDATIGATTQNFEHVYSGRQHLGNIKTTGQPVNGKVWKWETGAGMPNAGPIESPQRYTASANQFYMVSDERNTERKSYRAAKTVNKTRCAI